MNNLKVCKNVCHNTHKIVKYKYRQLAQGTTNNLTDQDDGLANDLYKFTKGTKWDIKTLKKDEDVQNLIRAVSKNPESKDDDKYWQDVKNKLTKLANHEMIPEHPLYQQGTKKLFMEYAKHLGKDVEFVRNHPDIP